MFRKLIIFFLPLCILSALWYGCVPKPTINEDVAREKVALPNAIERQYKSAYDEYKRGELDKAARHLQDFVIQYPRTALTDDALYFLGDIYLQRQEYKVAAIQFERLLSYFPSSPHLTEAQWSLARCYLKMGEYQDALSLARPLLSAAEDQPLWKGQLLVFLGECYAGLNDPLASLSWYARARREIPTAQRDEVRGKILDLLDQDLPPDQYREIEIAYPGTFIANYAKYRRAQSYFEKGRKEEAEGLLREAMKEAKGEDFYPLLEALWRQMQIGVGKEIVLGCILPLQGKAKSFGTRALHGIQLAMGAFRPREGSFRVRLVIWDDQGDPARAREGVKFLAEKEKVIAIIGPLHSQTALAAAEEAELRRIPLITLSPFQGIVQKRKYIFQNSITNALQTKTLARYALKELGIRTYAILYPRNTYGQTYRGLFQQEVESGGGKVLVAASYADDQTDFGDVIKGMVRYPRPQRPKDKPKPIVGFKAIFIPDDVSKINLVVPQLAYHDVTAVQLLGNNGWNSPDLDRESGKFFEGAVFVDGFFKDSPSPAIRSFVQDFEDTFQSSPTLLEALSFDTTALILKILSSTGAVSPETLLSFRDYVGVTGLTGFTPEGEGIRNLFVLKVTEGRIRQISPAE
ncbi:MAG: penicillin-binding protein activator [Desulfobacterales bacterium]|nr:penicillin-binding protein activator [Desulfobacterales bacterium]